MRYFLILLKIISLTIILSVVFGGLYVFFTRGNIPSQYESGARADQLARELQGAVKRNAWAETGAIKWSILDFDYLWDLNRGLVRAQFAQYEVLFDVDFKRFIAREHPTPESTRWVKIEGSRAEQVARLGYGFWLRDRFILEPTQSLFDEGVERYLVERSSGKASNPQKHTDLLVHYRRGAPNPGDTFLWERDQHGLPTSIRVWSDSLPVAWLSSGQAMKLERWRILDTGLKVSTLRQFGPFSFEIKVKAGLSLTHVIGRSDPLKVIEGDPFDPPPSSQPSNLPDKQRF